MNPVKMDLWHFKQMSKFIRSGELSIVDFWEYVRMYAKGEIDMRQKEQNKE